MKAIKKYVLTRWMQKIDGGSSILKQHQELNIHYGENQEDTFLFI